MTELGASRAKSILWVLLQFIEWKLGLHARHHEHAASSPTEGLYSCLSGGDTLCLRNLIRKTTGSRGKSNHRENRTTYIQMEVQKADQQHPQYPCTPLGLCLGTGTCLQRPKGRL